MKPFTQRELALEYKRRIKQDRINKLKSIDIVRIKNGKYAEYNNVVIEPNDKSTDIVVRIVIALVVIVSAITIVVSFVGK